MHDFAAYTDQELFRIALKLYYTMCRDMGGTPDRPTARICCPQRLAVIDAIQTEIERRAL